MERMLVVVFDDEKKTYDGYKALAALDAEGSISVHAEAIVKKNDNGTVTVEQVNEDFPISTLSGTAIGALIGVIGGPVGMAVGAVGGTAIGSILDMDRAGVNVEFLKNVSARLTPGKWAIVSEISEEWVTPVDTGMEALGGTVFRSARYYVEQDQNARDVAAFKADINQLQAELAKSRADQKARLQTNIDALNKKLNATVDQVKQNAEQQEKEARAKIKALEKNAADAKGEVKATIEKRIASIKKDLKKSSEDFDKWMNDL